ncbi:MAG: type II toxin-antitoxin system RelE/ParE family toxin [Candidatus Kariarchaeaceae archaeon]|jgi:addiction module RelE/StbE family toxin
MIIKWSPLSAERLTDIVNHISEDNPNAARKIAMSIFNSVEKQIRFPKSGRIVPELGNPKYREIFVGNYRIIYSIVEDAVHVLTVRHQKQLLKRKDI